MGSFVPGGERRINETWVNQSSLACYLFRILQFPLYVAMGVRASGPERVFILKWIKMAASFVIRKT
jgi:hypothetical protein